MSKRKYIGGLPFTGKITNSGITSANISISSIGSGCYQGCGCRDCVMRLVGNTEEMVVQRYYPDGTRPAEEAPRRIDCALFGVRDFLYGTGNLYSTYIENTWSPGREEHARCMGGMSHRAPHPECRCGLYSFYNSQAARHAGDDTARQGRGLRGVVSAWGDIVLHQFGFRSEYMRLEALIYEPITIKYLGEGLDVLPVYERISKRLEVALIIPEELGGFARERGLTVLNEQPCPQTITSWRRAGPFPEKGVKSGKDLAEEEHALLSRHYTNPQRPIPPAGLYSYQVHWFSPFSEPSWWRQ